MLRFPMNGKSLKIQLTSIGASKSAAIVDLKYQFNHDVKDDPDKENPGAPVWYVRLLQVHANENAWHCETVGNCADNPVEPEEETSGTGVGFWAEESKQWLKIDKHCICLGKKRQIVKQKIIYLSKKANIGFMAYVDQGANDNDQA